MQWIWLRKAGDGRFAVELRPYKDVEFGDLESAVEVFLRATKERLIDTVEELSERLKNRAHDGSSGAHRRSGPLNLLKVTVGAADHVVTCTERVRQGPVLALDDTYFEGQEIRDQARACWDALADGSANASMSYSSESSRGSRSEGSLR